ncbi:MAG: FkbM family methyltransferase [Pseudomonadota bacterium]
MTSDAGIDALAGQSPVIAPPLPRVDDPRGDAPRSVATAENPGGAGPMPGPLDCVIAHNRYGTYCIPAASRERVAARKVAAGGVWEPRTIEVLRAALAEGDVVHAGTYFGDFLPALAAACPAGHRVWAFEPNSENHRCARMTLALNGIDGRIVLTEAGLGAAESDALLVTHARDGTARGGASSIAATGRMPEGADGEQVRITAVDAVVPASRHVAAIQLDVEGYETAALEGALATIARCRPRLILEQVPDQRWMDTHLAPLGYREVDRFENNSHVIAE